MTKYLLLICFTLIGCSSMKIEPIKDGGCKLTGRGSGEGTIDGKCSVKKSVFTFPTIPVRINP